MAEERWRQSFKDRRYRQRKKAGLPRLLSEGDSWFGYPMHRNLVDYLDDTERWAIKRCEQSGDRLDQILDTGEFYPLIDKERPRCLLFSGGGNDMIDRAGGWPGRLFAPPVDGDGLNLGAWQAKLAELLRLYRRLVAMVDGRVPIVVHGYDHLIPSDRGAYQDWLPVSGPWFKPEMDAAGLGAPAAQRAIGRRLIDEFNAGLAALAAEANAGRPRRLVYHVDLRGTLDASDWVNEMHPYSRGFEKLARVVRRVLEDEVLAEWP